MTDRRLEQALERISAAEFAVPADRDPFELSLLALEALRSTDPHLRDDLAYGVLAHWIDAEVLSQEQVHDLLRRALSDEMLFAGIGERGTDSVFLRSFSLLVVAVALLRDNRLAFLSEDEWHRTLDRVVAYCEQERDLRAHIEGKGWAHAMAHVADVIDELARSPHLTTQDCERLLSATAVLVNRSGEVFQGEEDERLAIALEALLESGKVDPARLRAWVADQAQPNASPRDFADHARRVNWKLIARSLLLRLQTGENRGAATLLGDLARAFTAF